MFWVSSEFRAGPAVMIVCLTMAFCLNYLNLFLVAFQNSYSGLIVAVILTQSIRPPNADNTTTYSMFNGYAHVSDISVPPFRSSVGL